MEYIPRVPNPPSKEKKNQWKNRVFLNPINLKRKSFTKGQNSPQNKRHGNLSLLPTQG